MSNELALTESFQEKVFNRIRESIGDLMSDEDLKNLVDAAMEKAFFEDREVQDGYYHKKMEPSWLVTKVRELMQEKVLIAVKEWLEVHPEQVNKAIEEAIAKGMFGLVISYFENKINWPLQEFASKLRDGGLVR